MNRDLVGSTYGRFCIKFPERWATQTQPTEPLVLYCLLIEYVYIYTLQVIFGIPFGSEIDMWSVGCILAELYAGKPLFYGTDENSILEKVKCSYLVIILVTYINLIVIYMTQRFLSATVFTLCMSFFSFFLFFQFQFSLKLQYYIFRRKIGLIDWLKVCLQHFQQFSAIS